MRYVLSLGANLGNREETLAFAIVELKNYLNITEQYAYRIRSKSFGNYLLNRFTNNK